MYFHPNLSQLALRTGTDEEHADMPDADAGYPASEVPWWERHELVLGGCRVGESRQTECYDRWSSAVITEILEQPWSDTIVLLSVGAGVHELRTLKTLLNMRDGPGRAVDRDNALYPGINYNPIKRVWLIDPGMPPNKAMHVEKEFEKALEGVEVTYFCGHDAYERAIESSFGLEKGDVAVIGALNVNIGRVIPTQGAIEDRQSLIDFVLSVTPRYTERDRSLRVVTAWNNNGAAGPELKICTAEGYVRDLLRRLAPFKNLMRHNPDGTSGLGK